MGFSDRGYSRDPGQSLLADWTAVMTIMVVNIAIWVANLVAPAVGCSLHVHHEVKQAECPDRHRQHEPQEH
ncbi:MAG: hypothetical protein ACKOWG_15945, partial [Planctomycetia bacterium]